MMRLGIGDSSEDIIRSNVEASKGEISELVIDVTGQGRVSAEESIMMLEPRLENVSVVTILDPEEGEFADRKSIVKNSAGERPSEFYSDYFGDSAEVIMSRVEPEGLQKCIEEVEYVENSIRRAPEFSHGQTRFGTGIENSFIRSDSLEEAINELDQEIGFQIIFSYTGDAQASERFEEYMAGNSLFPGETDGVTGILSVGQGEVPEIYITGPREIEVDMPEFPGYSNSLERSHVYELI